MEPVETPPKWRKSSIYLTGYYNGLVDSADTIRAIISGGSEPETVVYLLHLMSTQAQMARNNLRSL